MRDRRPGDIPRVWREQPPPLDYPQQTNFSRDPYAYRDEEHAAPARRGWLADLSPTQQLGYGCMAVIIISTAILYCVGISTFLIRPRIQEHAATTPTILARPSLAPTPTQPIQPTSIIPLPSPRGTLLATPTQAPLPTRDTPTPIPTFDPLNPYTPTRRPSATGTTTVRP